MGNTSLFNLDLRNPLIFIKIDINPDELIQGNNEKEFLLCFELNPTQSQSIEPVKEQFLGNLLYSGIKSLDSLCDLSVLASQREENPDNSNISKVSLPVGRYLFMQSRGNAPMKQDKWLDMAIEQQKDGLWERNKLKNILYVRFLHEDGAIVTQIFRPLQ